MTFVVYLTIYSGGRLPPFYIGYSTEEKVGRGYNGSVTSKRYSLVWRQERREHPELFKTVILSQFDTDEEALVREEFLQRFFDVPNNPMYINMGIGNGKFGGSGENNGKFGTHHSKETILKMSLKKKGRKRGPLSDTHRQAISEGLKGRKREPFSDEWKRNIGKGHLGITPSEESRQKRREANLGEKNPAFGKSGSMKGKHHKEESIQKLRFPKSKLTCPHCGLTGGSNIMGRWHFDNCKALYKSS
jgi:FAD synthase